MYRATSTLDEQQAFTMETATGNFLASPHFAVAGASSDISKYGHKIFVWYKQHNLDTTPINPKSTNITAQGSIYETIASPSELPEPSKTSLSIVTPPAATLKILEQAKKAGVPAVWLQPGSFNYAGLRYAKEQFKIAIGGNGGKGIEGWCILVDGEDGMKAAGLSRRL